MNTWTWKGVAVYHQLCAPINPPAPAAAGPAPARFLSVSSPAELPVAFFFRHLTAQCRAQGRVTFDGRVDCFEVKAVTFCSYDSFWPPSLTLSPLSLPPSPSASVSDSNSSSLSSAVWCFALSLVWLCLHTTIQLQPQLSLSCLHASVMGLHARSSGLQLTRSLCECSNSNDKRKIIIRVNNITWLRLSCGARSVVYQVRIKLLKHTECLSTMV